MLRRNTTVITSVQNPKIKLVAQLAKPRARRTEQLFVIEGVREILLARDAGYVLQQVFWCQEVKSQYPVEQLFADLPEDVPIYEVSRDLFAKISYRDNVDGVLVLAQTRDLRLDRIVLSANPLILVLESVEKPGNLGAILRTADAAGVDAVIVCDPQTDIYNPNVVRSSLGCLFACQIAVDSSANVQAFLQQHGITAYAATLAGTQWYHVTDFTIPCAIILGTEAQGLSDFWLKSVDAQITIPMLGKVDSLNVSTSTAILVYEAKRQRGF
jgi:TrmH family RNA methyltransferase